MKTSKRNQHFVFQDLNEPMTILIARGDEVVTGTFKCVAGPFDTEEEAEAAVRELRKSKKR